VQNIYIEFYCYMLSSTRWLINFEKCRLDWEWIGSPVRMPKPEGQQHLKQKAGCVRFRL
jgi:hypothetical protein